MHELRQKIQKQRKSLSRDEILRLSKALSQKWTALFPRPKIWNDRKIALYRALPHEVSLHLLESYFADAGASLFYPKVMDSSKGVLQFFEALPPSKTQEQWHKNSLQIEEPPQDHPLKDPRILDLVFVPGVVFGEKGERVGTGAGYYDRFLSQCSGILKVAFAFDFQVVKDLTQESWDQKVDWILTPQREFRSPRANDYLKKVI